MEYLFAGQPSDTKKSGNYDPVIAGIEGRSKLHLLDDTLQSYKEQAEFLALVIAGLTGMTA